MKKFLTITFIKSKILEKINLTDSYNIVVQTSYSDVAKKLEDPNIYIDILYTTQNTLHS